jgi:osmotically inducible protein OsmC
MKRSKEDAVKRRRRAPRHTKEMQMPTRNASAMWEGGLRGGKGSYKGESGISGAYSFGSRFEQAGGSNPEELLAAAEAACYSMALSGALEKNGTPATRVETRAACTVEKVGDGFKITTMKLVVRASVPNADPATFKQIAEATKDGCPVSGALKGNVKIEVDAQLET